MIDNGDGKSVSTPFGAVVGQERLKRALLTVATDDGLGGLLVAGEKGTAKSTLVRGLADLLPDQRVIADCPYRCPPDDPDSQCADCRERTDPPVETRPVPLVTLPLGATRERVVGTLSVSDALSGEANFEPGLLARANRGILYVDEVNLLDDHLVDVLLDAAASGENRVERDGVSVTHPAAFTLVGTMNPEEGDLRPQLRDRFALSVEVAGETDIEDRVAIIDGALGKAEPDDDTDSYRKRLQAARSLLPSVELTDEQKRDIADLCLDAGVDGHRADIATARAARALAALDGRPTVTDGDLQQAAAFALAHRMRSTPFEDAPDADSVIDDHFEDGNEAESGDEKTDDGETDAEGGADADSGGEAGSDGDGDAATDEDASAEPDSDGESGSEDGPGSEDTTDPSGGDGGDSSRQPAEGDADPSDDGGQGDASDDPKPSDDADEEATPLVPGQNRQAPGAADAPDVESPAVDTAGDTGSGSARTQRGDRGARVRTEPADTDDSAVDAAASVRAAAKHGRNRPTDRDLRRSVRAGDSEALVVFAVDASASMRPAMRSAKGVVLELLEGAYTERDSVAVVAFAGDDAEVLLPPTDSVTLAARHLKDLPTGDRTPLPAGLRTAAEVVDRADPDAAVVVVVSDGRANAADSPTADTEAAAAALAETDARVVCVDAGDEDSRGLLPAVADRTAGRLVPLAELTPERVDDELGRVSR
ncbi:ATP-dependent cobaltochelatase subunit ChlID [Natronomonas pharaonis DSM 2160]|uniref:ATP-dependent cobaltochelatase subunit ChlID n=1 Tax=Natronomonas pharaonis (strain ATCC 35678 / DSM 2160 / CIP 103997 / JCM 8858 / NBRC 14720 / NCIMB 2260 / Gabara) TaxID=348780 RepID=A0A1U7EUJ7_NATPD|nr:VWA domain-containing protein [Natronomonas pharaonis]CAI48638.1 ATP-dependent cobaltochelatase subunit ChlID [Natronomonas pharaonis DSM 2160]